MNCINCGQPIPEGEGSLGFKYEPLSDDEIMRVNLPPLKLGLEPLQLGFECPGCKRNVIAIKDLIKRGALDGDAYVTMQQERKIVEHLKSHADCGCDLDGFCNEMRLLLDWKQR